jgi:ABC-2 type transport system ATP-binding protein
LGLLWFSVLMADSLTPVVSTDGLSRTFTTARGPVPTTGGLELVVFPGEAVCLTGPRGSGKTTTLRMLAGLLPPTAGSGRVSGLDLRREATGIRRQTGFVPAVRGSAPGAAAVPVPDVSVHTALTAQGLRGRLSPTEARDRAEELAFDLELTELLEEPRRSLTGAARLRLEIALALVPRPALLLLDEPAPALRAAEDLAELRAVLRMVGDQYGTAIVLTAHDAGTALALTDRVHSLAESRPSLPATPSPA